MPINVPQFKIESVPTAPSQNVHITRPLNDPSDIILRTAALQQNQDELRRISIKDLSDTITAAVGLMEHKRAVKSQEAHAQALLDLQQLMTPSKLKELEATTKAHEARAKLDEAQSQLFGGSGIQSTASELLKRETLPPDDPRAIPPGTTSNLFPRIGPARTALLGAYADNPAAGFSRSNIDYQSILTGAKTQQGSTFKTRVSAGESILPNFNDVVNIAKQIGLTQYAPINRAILAAKRQVNNPLVAKYDALRNSVSEEMARYFGGGVGSDQKIKLGQTILGSDGSSAEAIQESLLGDGGVYSVIQNQVQAFKGTKSVKSKTENIITDSIITRKLSDGRTIRLRPLGNGKYEEIK